MKELKKLGLVAILGLGMISCGGDDDSSSNEPQLDGVWKVTDITIDGMSYADVIECLDKTTIEFEGTIYESVSYEGEKCDEMNVENGTFTKSGNTLSLKSDGFIDTSEIIKLTDDKLELKEEDDEDITIIYLDRQ